jgi:hypothetical protein
VSWCAWPSPGGPWRSFGGGCLWVILFGLCGHCGMRASRARALERAETGDGLGSSRAVAEEDPLGSGLAPRALGPGATGVGSREPRTGAGVAGVLGRSTRSPRPVPRRLLEGVALGQATVRSRESQPPEAVPTAREASHERSVASPASSTEVVPVPVEVIAVQMTARPSLVYSRSTGRSPVERYARLTAASGRGRGVRAVRDRECITTTVPPSGM